MTQQPVQDINYKETLNLPVTPFPMKAGAAKREPEIEAFWESEAVYAQSLAAKDKQHRFLLHDGPPYLSSDKIHIGTALNKILKDIVTRYKSQQGFYSPYVPGYDGHGLPIENAVVKSIKGGRQAITAAELRKRCREFALQNLAGQEANFKRLGVWGNWEQPYITIDADFEATQIKLFGQMYQKGYVYKGLKPVYWCPTCETALADAEVEYDDHTSHSIYVAFPVKPCDTLPDVLQDAAFVIWTTTPWTMPANLALSLHPDFAYVVVQTVDWGKLIVAKDLLPAFAQAVGLGDFTVLAEMPGGSFEGFSARHPYLDRDSVVLTGTHVTLEAGTGVVHTAPGHGAEDYTVVQRYNQSHAETPLPILSPVDSRGVFTDEGGAEVVGLFYEKANPVVLDVLRQRGRLLADSRYGHSYPHCWRCHNPVIFRATEQWFINVDAFRAQALEAIRGVQWIPARGEARITSMVEGRSDWCISRQRVWGVPIPVFYCANADCRQELLNDATIARVEALFRAHTSDVWWERSAAEILGEGFHCTQCGSPDFTQEMDIMDVWFDSGVTHTAVVEARHEELGHLPVELYLEGSDQHRGWFQSSLLTSVMLHGQAPYRSVLTHGFVLDPAGRKMSKSLGNVIEPQTVIQQYGADILRLWVASVDYSNDVRIGQETLSQMAEVYKKVRNTVRYMLGNLSDFNPAEDRLPVAELASLDRYILHRLQGMIATVTEAFDRYEFYRYFQVLQNFCVVELSSLYFDVSKDTLYTHPRRSATRRGIQTVLFELLSTLVRMLVPIMPHLAEDIWLNLPEHQRPAFDGVMPVSVVLAPWPTVNPAFQDEALAARFEHLLKLKEGVNHLLEAPRAEGRIGSSLEADIVLSPLNDEAQHLVADIPPEELAALFITSTVTLVGSGTDAPLPEPLASREWQALFRITAQKATAEKCQRCWKYLPTVGAFAQHPTLCHSCCTAVESL